MSMTTTYPYYQVHQDDGVDGQRGDGNPEGRHYSVFYFSRLLLKVLRKKSRCGQVCASKVYTSAEFKREKDNFQSLCKNLERAETKKWVCREICLTAPIPSSDFFILTFFIFHFKLLQKGQINRRGLTSNLKLKLD